MTTHKHTARTKVDALVNRIPNFRKFFDVIPICHTSVSGWCFPPNGANFDGLVSAIDSDTKGHTMTVKQTFSAGAC